MKSRSLIVLGMVLFFPSLYAQLKEFDLSKYELPYIKRHQLDLTTNLNSNSSLSYNNVSDTIDDRNLRHFALLVKPDYSFFLKSEKYQGYVRASFGANSQTAYHRISDDESQKRRQFDTWLFINSENRFYFKNKFFFEPNVLLSQDHFDSQRKDDILNNETDPESTMNNISTNSSFELLVGKGRIENVEDMRLALYIFEELQKVNRLSRIPAEEEIIEFAKFISILKNKRFFDSRIKRIEDLEEIDEFLMSKNLISENDVTSHAIIMDNWEFAEGPVRKSGWKVSLGISPKSSMQRFIQASYFNDSVTQEYDRRTANSELLAVADFTYSRPINLNWQFDNGVRVEYGKYMEDEHVFESDTFKSDILRSTVFLSLGYYPNSRSEYNLNVSASYEDYFTEEKEKTFVTQLELIGNYYISAKLLLRLSANAGFRNYEAARYEGFIVQAYKQGFEYSLNAGFTYKIF